ncbi:hemolysin family protein [Muricomes intestini]|uniref:hemolysin family protein n=1 Tax=Muricomes intestini TaxID=1796634 RepID=UPI002FE40296
MDADPDGNTILFRLELLLFFTLMNAFFAGAEMAVVSVNKTRIRSMAEEGNKKAVVIQSLFEDSTKFLSTIQVAITFAGFYSSASAAAGIAPVLADWMKSIHVPYSDAIASNGVTLLLMFFNLVFGELVPKRVALQKAETFCMITVMPIHYISKVLSPFIKLLSVSTKGVLKLLGLKTEDQEEAVTEEEIRALMKMGNENGTFDDDEREMINSVFSFDDRSAREVMVPRRDVYVLDVEKPFDALVDEILESRHSRIPVYEGNIDNIIGILHMKDVMIAVRKHGLEPLNIRKLLRKPFFVPDSRDADDLFRELQKQRRHMAVLVDEYGGFSGIVTIEDLVEEIMGEISEEYEEVVQEIVVLGEGEYLLDGGILIDDLNEEMGLKLVTENYDTLSGYLIEKLGYIPGKECRETILADDLEFTIEEVKGNRITKIIMRKISS